MAIADITKPMALDETLQATNTKLENIEDDIESIGTALDTLNTTTNGIAKDTTLNAVNTALGAINTALGTIKNAIDAMAVSNIGNMSALTTTDKSSLVGAVNEVNSSKISKSQTVGLVKNDGTIDTENYSDEIDAITNVYGSKNLLKYPYRDSTHTDGNLTWTSNSDGTINVNGSNTSGSTSNFYFTHQGTYKVSDVFPCAGKYYVSCDGRTSDIGCNFYIADYYNDILPTEGKEYTITDAMMNKPIAFFAYVASGVSISNVTIYPMLRDARISDSTYVPYAMTNRELTEKVIKETYSIGKESLNNRNSIQLKKVGNLINIDFYNVILPDANAVAKGGSLEIANIPLGLRPIGEFTYPVRTMTGGVKDTGFIALNIDGTVIFFNTGSSDIPTKGYLRCTLQYML